MKTWCPQCGKEPAIDEDGCCLVCGCVAVGEGVDELYALLEVRAPGSCQCGDDEACRFARERDEATAAERARIVAVLEAEAEASRQLARCDPLARRAALEWTIREIKRGLP